MSGTLRNLFSWIILSLLCACAGREGLAPLEESQPASLRPLDHSATHITLLLPQSGPLSSAGRAIRDGFEAAQNESGPEAPTLRVLDTATAPITALYAQAAAEHPSVIVGPLKREHVDTLWSSSSSFPVPTLLLNYASHTWSAKDHAWQFGLSPKDEAYSAAQSAVQRGYRRALVLSPPGRWAEDVTASFIKAFRDLGGTIVEQRRYAAEQLASEWLPELFRVHPKIRAGGTLKLSEIPTAERHRRDIDMVFFVGSPKAAAQLMPNLRYFLVSDLPVYATSSAYGGHRTTRHDVKGLILCDMPSASLEGEEHFSERHRLMALGRDAYRLALDLARGQKPRAFSGHTGGLRLGEAGMIQRSVVCRAID